MTIENQTVNPKKMMRYMNTESLRAFIPFLGLILILAIFGIATNGKFTSAKNLQVILNQAISVMIAGLGVSFVISIGSLDFSHGSLVAFSAALGALVMGATNNPVLCFLTIIAVAAGTGLINGVLFTAFRIPSFILTMSILFMYRGLTIVVCSGGTIPIPLWMDVLDTLEVKLAVLVVVLLVFNYIYTFTKFGLYCRSIGSGEVAAKFAGVPVDKIKIMVFVISGFLAGVTACIMLVRSGGVSTRFATFLETDILTALVLGGMPLTGGSSARMKSIVIGAFMLMALKNGLLLVGASDKILQLLMGVLFLIAVAISFDRKNIVAIK